MDERELQEIERRHRASYPLLKKDIDALCAEVRRLRVASTIAEIQAATASQSKPTPNRVITADEVARRLCIRVPRVYDLVRAGVLPHVRVLRQIRFTEEAIESFIASGGARLSGGWRRDPAEKP